jgi:hypothetical protein
MSDFAELFAADQKQTFNFFLRGIEEVGYPNEVTSN